MKKRLSALAVFASLALGLGFAGSAGATTAIGAAGAVNAAVGTTLGEAEPLVEQVGQRGRHSYRGGGQYGRHHYGRHQYGRHRDWRPRHSQRRGWHHSGPGVGLHFHFGGPAYRYAQPRHVQPRYVQPRSTRVIRLSGAHYDWCYARYRSYRSSDNTFNPGRGMPRRACISPYS